MLKILMGGPKKRLWVWEPSSESMVGRSLMCQRNRCIAPALNVTVESRYIVGGVPRICGRGSYESERKVWEEGLRSVRMYGTVDEL